MSTIVEANHSGRTSEAATSQQLALARAQGEAFGKAVAEMASNEIDDGHQIAVGDVLLAYAIQDAEGMYRWVDGHLVWQEAEHDSVHLAVVVRDAQDGRFIPSLDVTVTLVTEDGDEIGPHEQPFLWHPWLYHYGRDWTVPGRGRYRMTVHIDPASFMRHDQRNGARFAEPIDVRWHDVRIEPGQERS